MGDRYEIGFERTLLEGLPLKVKKYETTSIFGSVTLYRKRNS